MPIERVFLGWDRPLCETAPQWLLRDGGAGAIDLRGTVVGVPTRQSSWRLRAALPLAAHERYGAALLSPEILTASVLIAPPSSAGCASEFQTLLAWCAVLRETPPDELGAFLGKQRSGSTAWALQVARRLISLRRELADGMLSIGDVAVSGKLTDEADRWQAMAELEERYLERLNKWGLRDAIRDQFDHAHAGQLMPDVVRVVLAAVPDPPRMLISLLEAWARRGGSVTVLVAAPDHEASAFDDWGRPLPDVWTKREIKLAERDILLCANPEEQAARIAAMLKDGYRRDDSVTIQPENIAASEDPLSVDAGNSGDSPRPAVAIGVPDRETVAPLQRELESMGWQAFDPQNRPLADTALFRLVQALLEWHERPGYAETASLLRHPHIIDAMPDADRSLRGLDAVQARHLPVTFDDLCQAAQEEVAGRSGQRVEDEAPSSRKNEQTSNVQVLFAALEWLKARRRELQTQSLADGLRAVLQAVYDQRLLHTDRAIDQFFQQSAESLDAVLRELADAEAEGQAGKDYAAVLMERLQGVMLKSERAGEPLDLEGWLELAWNPAPVLCVAGMNEGFVPDGRVGDLFLPDALRQTLELRDDRLRVARDSYLLTALCAQRSGDDGDHPRVVLLVGKRAAAGDPLRPSRLVFRCPDDVLIQRAKRLYSDPPPSQGAAAHAIGFKLDPALVPPSVIADGVRQQISPTALRAYLECPFRCYLGRVLKMRSADDRAREPDALGFGNLCHAVLEVMGRDRDRIWACGDARRLGDWLESRLREKATELYGKRPWLGVTLAVESAAGRLRAFARHQVAWHAEGWEIVEPEAGDYKTVLDGVTIGGRIDRIDCRRPDGEVCLLDYKTSDAAKGPAQTHLGSVGDEIFLPEAVLPEGLVMSAGNKPIARRWLDLQLPLYREMARVKYGPDVGIGYILLPAALGDTAFARWDGYNDGLHSHALDCTRAILGRIRAGDFWPPTPKTLPYDDYADLILNEPLKTFNAPPVPWSSS